MGVWATVNGIRAMVIERVIDWDGEEHFRVFYSRDAAGNAPGGVGIPGMAATGSVVWDCRNSEWLVPTRRVRRDESLNEREVQELEGQWAE